MKLKLGLLSAVLALLWAAEAGAACKREYSIAHAIDYVPYQYTSEKDELVGLDVDIIKRVMKELRCPLRIEPMPSKRAQKLLVKGDLDLMAAASLTPERQDYAYFSIPYRDETIVMFVQRENFEKYQGLTFPEAVERQLPMVAGAGGWYGVEYGLHQAKAKQDGILKLNNSTEHRLLMLLYGRVEIVIADLFVGYHHAIAQGKALRIAALPHILNSDPVHFMLSRATVSVEEVEDFNRALKRVMRSPDYQKLLQSYRPGAEITLN